MNIITQILAVLGTFCISVISSIGYLGIFFLMILESMIVPIPSELVMPFAGFLVATGDMNLWWVVLFATLGSLAGSLLSYYMGLYGGNRFVKKYGKYFLLNQEHLTKTEKWFSKKGELTIFIGRFVPVVRHFISIPAGIGKMNLRKFIIYTVIGAGIWNFFLAYVGFILGKNWAEIKHYINYFSWTILAVIILLIVYFLWKEIKKKRRKNKK